MQNSWRTGRALGDLRRLRLTAGLTLDRASRKVGTDKSMLCRYEAAEVKLPARLVGPMAEAYGTTVTQVLAANERDWLRREAAEGAEPQPAAPTPKRPRRRAGTKEAAS